MNPAIFEYVKDLSLADTKSLNQKLTKAVEELGELAKVILPYEGAFATEHRFATRSHLLEEAVDLTLCALSIAYSVGCSHDDIEKMLMRKSMKWQHLQTKAGRAKWPLPFEIHVTVARRSIAIRGFRNEDAQNIFKNDCATLKVKAIVLDLNTEEDDFQTSSVIITNNTGAYLECRRIVEVLRDRGYTIVRQKIETVPWHPMAPQHVPSKAPFDLDELEAESYRDHSLYNPPMPDKCYFESHFAVMIEPEKIPELRAYAEKRGNLHVSQNILKRVDDKIVKIMMTLRGYSGTAEWFRHDTQIQAALLQGEGFTLESEPIVEFTVYDTNLGHDNEWLKIVKEEEKESRKGWTTIDTRKVAA